MNAFNIRKYILITIIGFLFLGLNCHINTGLSYPRAYENDPDIIGEFQYYNIKTFYGATCTYEEPETDNTNSSDELVSNVQFVDDVFFDGIRLDIFINIIGLLLIAIGCFYFSKAKRAFNVSTVFAIIAIIIDLVIFTLPFVLNGIALCYSALVLFFAFMSACIICTLFMSKGYISLISDSCCREERLWLNTAWFISIVLQILVFILRWLSLDSLATVFNTALIIDIIIFGFLLKRVIEFIIRNCPEEDKR